jgi:predicted ArsR family transcriptional regulator
MIEANNVPLSPLHTRILNFALKHPNCTTAMIGAALKTESSNVAGHMTKLHDLGYVEREAGKSKVGRKIYLYKAKEKPEPPKEPRTKMYVRTPKAAKSAGVLFVIQYGANESVGPMSYEQARQIYTYLKAIFKE